ncbi:hypothetical protein PENTCL1PPCAC_3251 [Pristionchus entomophagus]|uniref:Insulin-like domain-containing protein n=1 Tax=Pristionchus entomophagus TaxID=358040 RepID=A0AAV5SCM5_9BILA|nr:hypothetical protein PENTCL1PPCAC_3251 [Pristionchus entomophagus]
MLRVFSGFLIISGIVFLASQNVSKSISKRATDEVNHLNCVETLCLTSKYNSFQFCGKRMTEKLQESMNSWCPSKGTGKYPNSVKLNKVCCENKCTERQLRCFICDE